MRRAEPQAFERLQAELEWCVQADNPAARGAGSAKRRQPAQRPHRPLPSDGPAPQAYDAHMFTVVETALFQKQWALYWTEDERGEFSALIALNPQAGVVVRDSGGIRKVRWKRQGSGKSGGVRVIYFTRTELEELVLLTLYAKAATDNLTGAALKEIRRALEDQATHCQGTRGLRGPA